MRRPPTAARPLLPHASARLFLAVAIALLATLVAAQITSTSGSAASIATGVLPIPRPNGMTVGFAGTSNPETFAEAQPFEVASVSMFHVATQSWTTYVPGAPGFANTLTGKILRADDIVFAKRTGATALVSAPIPIAGAPVIELLDEPQRFETPPPDGLTLGVSGTTDPVALAERQFFRITTMNAWSVAQQRYFTYIPGAPAIVNTLTAANLNVTDVVWLKTVGAATGGVLLEDTPFLARLVPFGEAGTLLEVGEPLNGTLIDNGDGSVTYVPNDDFNGEDSFTYTVMTANGPEQRTFRLEVTPDNDAPIANDDAAVAEDGAATIIAVLDNDEDPDDDEITILKTTQPRNGVVAIAGNAILYTPTPKYSGVDTFTYEITDGIAEPGDESAIATVFVAVGGAELAGPPPGGGGGGAGAGGEEGEEGGEPDPPFLSDDPIALETCDGPIVIDPLANDAGDGVTPLVITSVSAATLGTASDNGDGTVTYTPPVECEGVDSFGYTVPDAEGADQSATVTVTMGEAAGGGGDNQPPEALDDSGATFENEPVTIAVLANDVDPDGDELSISSLTQPGGGAAVDNGDGTVTYTANGFAGQTSFTYTVSDGRGGEATASVSITVEAAPVAPVGPVIVQAGGLVTIQVVAPSAFVQLDSVTNGSHGSTSMNAGAGTVTYQPESDFVGDDWITWTLLFSHGGTAQTTLQLQVVN